MLTSRERPMEAARHAIAPEPRNQRCAHTTAFVRLDRRTETDTSSFVVQLIEDPELEEKVLSAQLREAGLYAANILGGERRSRASGHHEN